MENQNGAFQEDDLELLNRDVDKAVLIQSYILIILVACVFIG